MALSKTETKHLLDQASSFHHVRFVWPDINGIARGRIVVNNGSAISDNIKHGMGFYDGSFWMGPNGELPTCLDATVMSNCLYKPVSDRIRSIKWAGGKKYGYGEILCEPFSLDGKILETNTRFLARKQLEELKSMGLELYSAFEAEFYLLDRETLKRVPNTQYCSTFALSKYEGLFFEIEEKLKNYGISLETIQCEYPCGQFEVTFLPSYGIADTCFLFKAAMKELCEEKGYLPTFMTKPFDVFHNALHFNHSPWTKEGTNAFYNEGDGFSDLCKFFLAGIMKHAKAMTALSCATTNCYRCLNGGDPTIPNTVIWAEDCRSALVRAKHVPSQCNTFLENRLPSGSSNPYLVLASTLAAGIDGIQNREPLPPANIPVNSLPLNLSDALDALACSDVMKTALGGDFVEKFVTCKRYYDVE